MYTCSKCNFKTETAINYCPQCGGGMLFVKPMVQKPAEPTFAQPVQQNVQPPVQPQPANQAYTTQSAPAEPMHNQYNTQGYSQPTAQFQAEPTYAPPSAPQQNQYNAYNSHNYSAQNNNFYQPVNEPKVSVGRKIAGMVLSIIGAAFAFFTFIGTLDSMGYEDAFDGAFILTLLFGALPIIGLVLSNKCRNDGDTSPISKVGKILGIVGLALFGLSLFFGFVSLA